jgi:hypothetical protein
MAEIFRCIVTGFFLGAGSIFGILAGILFVFFVGSFIKGDSK